MPDEKKLDPFKPQAPSIPGVLPGEQKAQPEPPPPPEFPVAPRKEPSSPHLWTALAGLAAIFTVAGLLYWSRSPSPKPNEPAADAAVAAPVAVEAPKPDRRLPVAPGPVATTEEMAKTWSSKKFMFRDPLSSALIPAMVVRLPRGEYWGFSLREPYGNCELEFVTDLQKLETEYRFHADHPMVGNPCNHAVYDLLRYGGGATNDEVVRGVIVQGTGIRPPMAIEIRTEDTKVLAERIE